MRLPAARIVGIVLALCGAFACGSEPAAPPPIETDPAAARMVTSDLERFWSAYDAGGQSGSAAAFQAGYLDPASPGLKDFIRLRHLTSAAIAAMVSARPRYFAAIRANSLGLAAGEPALAVVRANYQRMKALYPPAVFPPITILVGRFSTAGTISAEGVLIGGEFYGRDETTPLDELGAFERDNVKPVESLPIVIAHEHAHILQARGSRVFSRLAKTLLDQALLEGGADFVGELVSGGNINARMFPWALANERALWDEFRGEMHGADVSRWLYNQGAEPGARPGDLGYFVGYRIAQSFYQRAGDPAAAVAAILEVSDADAFLAQSGYAP